LRLDRNEGRAITDFRAWECIHPELLCRYPSAADLEALIARRWGVAPEQILVTAGGDDALARACLAFVEPDREMLLPVPTFEMLVRYGRLAGGQPVEIPWLDTEFPLVRFLDGITERTAVVAVVTPNNPTGAAVNAAELKAIAAKANRSLVLVDLAYAEFANEDLTSVVLEIPHALAVRTFSKAWGLAGLRVGYAIGSADIVRCLRVAGNPYAVAGPSAAFVAAQLAQPDQRMRDFVDRVRRERETLREFLVQRGVDALPSQANFVFARLDNAEFVWNELGRRQIAVRWFGNQPLLKNSLRITCPGGESDFQLLLQALDEILRSD
jgi:histidinol-phosphate aminotransferase